MRWKSRVAAIAVALMIIGVLVAFGLGSPQATIRVVMPPGVFAAGIPTYSGIENIYIVDNAHGAGWDRNFGDPAWDDNVLGVITASGGSVNISYEKYFRIIIAVKGKAPENMAYVVKENIKVEFGATGSFTIALENSPDVREFVFENLNYGTTSGWLRMNAAWDNAGVGYKLPAGGNLTLDLKLWCWK